MHPNTQSGGKLAAITFLTMADRDAVAAAAGACSGPRPRTACAAWPTPFTVTPTAQGGL